MTKKRIVLGIDADSIPTAMNFFPNGEKFDVTVVHDGHEALRRISKDKPDLAILDIDLPKKGGDACCREVKEGGLSLATLIVLEVWLHNGSDVRRCLEAGCDALLVKPLEYEPLAGIITRLLFGTSSTPPRFNVRLPVHYGIQPDRLIDNYSVNLSTGGVFLEAQHVVPVGTPLTVVITLPNNTTIECTAEVTWLNGPVLRCQPLLPPGMGLKFLDIGNQQVNAIREFLFSEERLFSA